MSETLKLFIAFYIFGIIIMFLMGFEGISRHITWKGLKATIIMSLFSVFALLYIIFGGSNKNNYY